MMSPGLPEPRPDRGAPAPPSLTPGASLARKGPWRRGASISALVVLGILAYQYGWRTHVEGAGGGKSAGIPSAVAEFGELRSSLRLSGTVAARNQATITAPRLGGSRSDFNRGGSANMLAGGGRGAVGGGGGVPTGFGASPMTDFSLVLVMLAPPGSRVKAGDVVARFDQQMQQQRLDDYRDTLLQSDANISSRLARLAASRESHLLKVQEGDAAWLQALQDQKTNPVDADITVELNDLAVTQDEAQYRQLEDEDELVDEQQQAEIKVLQLNRDQANAEYKRTLANLDKLTIKAPMDGVVVMASIVRNGEFGQVQVGDEVRAGQPFMYIEDNRSMVVNATVNQVDAERLRPGLKADIRLDAYSDIDLPGTVEGIGALALPSTFRAGYVAQIPVLLSLDKMDPRIIPDLTASAEIYTETQDGAVFVPRAAVFSEAGDQYVFLRQPNGWFRKPVTTGLATYEAVAIQSGIQKGDVVALQRP
jgi:HlyD family secretion protein